MWLARKLSKKRNEKRANALSHHNLKNFDVKMRGVSRVESRHATAANLKNQMGRSLEQRTRYSRCQSYLRPSHVHYVSKFAFLHGFCLLIVVAKVCLRRRKRDHFITGKEEKKFLVDKNPAYDKLKRDR